jgi:hypothetical protein
MGNFDNFNKSRNNYFRYTGQEYSMEKRLLSQIYTEAINKFGNYFEYFVTSYNTKYQPIFGEDSNRRFIKNFEFMAFFQIPNEEKMYGKFGIETQDINNINMWISKRHFRYVAGNINGVEVVPKIGDIVRMDFNNMYYEIIDVPKETGYEWLHSNQHVWELQMKIFKDEQIKTTNTDTSASNIVDYTNKDDDIFDVTDIVDIKNEDLKYEPKPTEKPSNNKDAIW